LARKIKEFRRSTSSYEIYMVCSSYVLTSSKQIGVVITFPGAMAAL